MPAKNETLLNELTELLNAEGAERFCTRLREVVMKQGGFARLAEAAGLNRESLYKAFSGERNPRFQTIVDALAALGMKFRVEIDSSSLEQNLAGVSGFEGAWLDLYLLSPKERLQRADEAVKTFNELSVTNAADKHNPR